MLANNRQSAAHGILPDLRRPGAAAQSRDRPTNLFSCAGPTESVANCDLSHDRRLYCELWTLAVGFLTESVWFLCPLPTFDYSSCRCPARSISRGAQRRPLHAVVTPLLIQARTRYARARSCRSRLPARAPRAPVLPR